MTGETISPDLLKGGSYLDEPPAGGPVAEQLSPEQQQGGQFLDDTTGASPAAKPSGLEAVLRGGLQGATLGFSDELAGAIESVISDKSYQQARDESRKANAAAQKEHPWLYGGGELGGGAATLLIPGVGAAGGLGKALATGATAGLGGSEADLAKGEYGKAALDTAIGAGLGGVAHGVGSAIGKVVGGAGARVEAADVGGLKEGVQYSTKLKTFGKATPEAPGGTFTQNIKAALKSEPTIKRAIRADPHKALTMVDQKVEGLVEGLSNIYEKAVAGGPVPTDSAVKALGRAAGKFTTTADEGIASTIDGVAKRLAEKHPEGIPVQALREEYRAWQDVANRSMKLFSSKSPKEEAAEATANALRETLQAHVHEVATAMPELGISRKALEATNREVSTWLRVRGALTEKASRINVDAAPFGDTVNFVGNAIKHPIRTAADLAGRAALPADRAIDAITRLAKAGHPEAIKLLQMGFGGAQRGAIAAPRALPNAAMASLAPPDEEQALAEAQ